jgi:hypothetical protein
MLTEKIATADMVIQAVEKFAQYIPLNVQEIFLWYFEQKGVENPERFLDISSQIQNVQQTNEQTQDGVPQENGSGLNA